MIKFDNDISKHNFNIQQEKLIRSNQNKISLLSREKQRTLENYDKKIKQLEMEIEQIQNITYINMKDSFEAIAYLVSKMEGILYSCYETSICLFEQANDPVMGDYPNPIYYRLIYLVKNGLEAKALMEIKERFKIRKINQQEWDYYSNQKFLNMDSSNYIQLAYFKDNGNNWNEFQIHYNNKNNNISGENKLKLYTTIYDERYFYITRYMNKVVNYRLYRPNFSITLDEMLLLADEFVEECKNIKSLKKTK